MHRCGAWRCEKCSAWLHVECAHQSTPTPHITCGCRELHHYWLLALCIGAGHGAARSAAHGGGAHTHRGPTHNGARSGRACIPAAGSGGSILARLLQEWLQHVCWLTQVAHQICWVNENRWVDGFLSWAPGVSVNLGRSANLMHIIDLSNCKVGQNRIWPYVWWFPC